MNMSMSDYYAGPRDGGRRDIHIALSDLNKVLEAMAIWGQNAKDPLGNFMPQAYAVDAKAVFDRLKWLIAGEFSKMGEPKGSSHHWRYAVTEYK